MIMKRILGIIAISILFFGCNMNPNKEARIQKLETEIQQSMDRINQLEKRVATLESKNELLKSKIQEIENQ